MWHYVVVEVEQSRQYNQAGGRVVEQCWNILYKVPMRNIWTTAGIIVDHDEFAFTGCLSWIENNKVEGSKYAVMKMYIVN